MKFWLWRMPALTIGMAMLAVIAGVDRTGLLLLMAVAALSVVWQRKEVAREFDYAIAQVEKSRPQPKVSAAAWFKEGWDMARRNPQATYEPGQDKGRDEIIVYEQILGASKQKAPVPVLRVGSDYYVDMLEAYAKPRPDKAAVKH